MWVGTQQGLVLYETGSQTWTPVATCGSAAPRIDALAFDAATGDLWIGTVVESSGQASAIRLGPGGCESWTPSDGPYGVVDSIALDPARQDVWYGTSNGAYRWRMGSGWTQYWTQPGGLLHEHVWAASVGPDGDIWLGTSLGLNRLKPTETPEDIDKWSAYLTHDAIGGTNINDVVLDSAGRVWATAAKNTSLNILDPATNRWQAQLTCPEAGYPGVLAADSAGRLWIDREVGVVRLDPGGDPFRPCAAYTWEHELLAPVLGADSVTALAVNRILADEVWIGTTGGVTVGRTGDGGATYTWTTYTASNTAAGLAGDDIKDIAFDASGNAWVATNGGLSVYAAGSWHAWTTPEPLADVSAVAVDGSGVIWVAAGADLVALSFSGPPGSPSNIQRTIFHFSDGLAGWIGAITPDAGRGVIWLGTGAGVSVLDPAGTPHNKTDDHWYTYRTTDGLADDRVSGIALGSGNEVWFATDGGLGRASSTIPAGTACERAVNLGNQASYAADIASATDADVYRIETAAGDASLKLALSDPDNRLSLNLYRSCDIETSARRNTSARRSISARRNISAARPGWSMTCAGSRAPTTPSSRPARVSAASRLPIAWPSPSAAWPTRPSARSSSPTARRWKRSIRRRRSPACSPV